MDSSIRPAMGAGSDLSAEQAATPVASRPVVPSTNAYAEALAEIDRSRRARAHQASVVQSTNDMERSAVVRAESGSVQPDAASHRPVPQTVDVHAKGQASGQRDQPPEVGAGDDGTDVVPKFLLPGIGETRRVEPVVSVPVTVSPAPVEAGENDAAKSPAVEVHADTGHVETGHVVARTEPVFQNEVVERVPVADGIAPVLPGGALYGIGFADLYLESGGRCWYKRAPGDFEGPELSGAARDEAYQLRAVLESRQDELGDYRVTWEGMALRVDRLNTLKGHVFVCRRLTDAPMRFETLGYPVRLVEAMLSDAFQRGGVVLFTGAAGVGKSTSLASWVAARLRRFGGTAWTIENPIELALEGIYPGENGVIGTCYQTEVQQDVDFGPRVRRLLRAAPNMILLGEIRHHEAAAEAALAGASGHILAATVHGTDVLSSLERFKAMVNAAGHDTNLMAESLCAVVHQTMRIERVNGEMKRRIHASPLIVSGTSREKAIRAALRQGEFAMLASELDRQKRWVSGASGEGGL